jgi:hypothetical protein
MPFVDETMENKNQSEGGVAGESLDIASSHLVQAHRLISDQQA